MNRISPFSEEHLEGIAKVLGDTNDGLAGTEIGHTLAKCRIPDVDSANTKWKRLYNALAAEQNRKQYGNHVVGFIHHSMKPVRWSDRHNEFEHLRSGLNRVLAFCGLTIEEDGGVRYVQAVSTIPEAEQRADKLRSKLKARDVHADVLQFCRAELLQENYFHAVLEATKSVANKIRSKSGLTEDGAELANKAFSLGKSGTPLLAINPLTTETHKGEQRGFTNLPVGLFGTFRNPTAHAEKIYWPITEQDAMDILSIVSLVHRKLDAVVKITGAI